MTVNEFLNNLSLESEAGAVEIACECVQYDIYGLDHDYYDDTAIEGSLVFDDDEDIYGNYYGAATEGAGKEKVKGWFEKVKSWFKKIADTIKGWVKTFVSKIKTARQQSKDKSHAMTVAGYESDRASISSNRTRDLAAIDEKIKNAQESLDKAKTTDEKTKFTKKIDALRKQRESIDNKADTAINNIDIKLGQEYANRISSGISQAISAFDSATKIEDTIFDALKKVLLTSSNSSNKESNLIGQDLGWDSANNKFASKTSDEIKSAVSNVSDADKAKIETLYKKVDGLKDKATDIASDLDAVDERVKSATDDFTSKVTDRNKQIQVMMTIRSKVNLDTIVKNAQKMGAKCDQLASATDHLANSLKGDDDKNIPAISKFFSAYSTVANSIVKICSKFITISNYSARILGTDVSTEPHHLGETHEAQASRLNAEARDRETVSYFHNL